MKSINHYTTIYTSEEKALANEIAQRLDDIGALSQFLRYTKEVPHEYLRQCLENACAVPDYKVDVSRAAIFVGRVKNYKQFNNGNSRY